VHTAECEHEVDLQTVREGYTLCLLSLVERLPLLPGKSGNPIQFIIEGPGPPALLAGSYSSTPSRWTETLSNLDFVCHKAREEIFWWTGQLPEERAGHP
jgi:hypothetical protein